MTNLHRTRVVEQVITILRNVQKDMRRNATVHKQMAQAQTPDHQTLKTYVNDCAATYLQNLQLIIDRRGDAVKKQQMLDILTKMGWTESDIVDTLVPLRQAAIALRDAPRSTYAEIITACDNVLSAVDAPDSLWPE